MKPSEQVKAMIPGIAEQRLKNIRGNRAANGHIVLMTDMQRQRALESLQQDPMTWIIAILSHLDMLQETIDARDKEAGTEVADLEKRVDGLDRVVRDHLKDVE